MTHGRPTGTVAFLFTDIEGSTQRWERNPGAMASALARHNALMREAIDAHNGYVFKVVGDGFFAAFPTASEALAAALRSQRSLLAEDFSSVDEIRVRMALHSGDARESDGDYLGPALNRAARLLAVGHGGQILLSGAAAELLHEALPANTALRDLGTHRLKDLARAERVYQIVASGLTETFPPLRSLENLPNNLPRQLTSFVGRDETLAELRPLIEAQPLVTLVGAGGAGKTRCAIQAAAEAINGFPDGVWLVELAPLSNASLVVGTIAFTLGVREIPNRPLLDTLADNLALRRLLLVLDNCEHVVAEARSVAAAIVRRCPTVRILATSREALGIGGERVVRISPLAADDAAALFADRARAANDRFTMNGENEALVAQIVARLDGIPLAIELAAARINVLSPRQLTERLGERFRVLTGGDRTALPRQQTLRATIDWSFDLLEERERTLFAALSVFAGGWTLAAAAKVCAVDDAMDEWAVLDAIASLADKSLVVVDSTGAEARYRMLASIRQYAVDRLIESGKLDAVASIHARYFAEFVDELAPLVAALEDVEWSETLGRELDNLRAAIEWTILHGHEPSVGQLLLSKLEWPESITTPHEALDWFETASRGAATDPLVHARILRHCVLLEWLVGRPLARREETALRALEAARASGDTDECARALANLGACYRSVGRFDEADHAFTQAYAQPERLSRITANAVLRLWAVTDLQRGNVERARRRFSEVASRERPGSEAHASALLNLGELHFAAGNVEAARAAAREAKEAYGALNSVYLVLVLSNLGAYAIAAGDMADARCALRDALALQRASRSGWLTTVLEHHALLAAVEGDLARAAVLLGFTDRRYASSGEERQHTERHGYERLVELLNGGCRPEERRRRMSEGEHLSEEQALVYAAAIHEGAQHDPAATPKGDEPAWPT